VAAWRFVRAVVRSQAHGVAGAVASGLLRNGHRGGGGRRCFERVDHVVVCSCRFVVPGRKRLVVDAFGELVECRGVLLER
jgi:hypothetical protein